MREQVEVGDPCSQCGHPFSPHSLIATTGDPQNGGIILCPEPGCECFSTWGCSFGGGKSDPPKRIPDRFEVAHLREVIQSPAKNKLLPRWLGVPEDQA
jgi:hypothetical protein